MYVALLALLLAAAAWLVLRGFRDGSRMRIGLGLTLGLATGMFFAVLSFYGEMLWFQALGYGERFWTAVLAEAGFFVAGGVAGGLLTLLLALPVRDRRLRWTGAALGAAVGALWGYGAWDVVLRFVHRSAAGVAEPVLGLDAGYYLFTLPLLDALYTLVLTAAVLAVGAAVVYAVLQSARRAGSVVEMHRSQGLTVHPAASRELGEGAVMDALGRTLAVLALVLAAGRLLAVPHLLHSQWGAVSGPGWTDVHVRLPALLLVAAVTAAGGVLVALRRTRRMFADRAVAFGAPRRLAAPVGLLVPAGGVLAVWIVALGVVPAGVQTFWVEPNEISFEAPYIGHNIALTRHAFGLDAIDEREYPATAAFTADTARENREVLEEARLWDWRALDSVYRQFQEIRLYYEFVDVDIDRYTVDGDYRQVMAPVAEFTPEGLPRLLIRDLPPVSASEDLAVERPQIYYGELTDTHVYVNTEEEEFDHPRGDQNVTIRYPGRGGVQLSNLWRRFVVGWMFDGTRFFLSEYPTPESRVMFHREVRERVDRVAPFLELDDDPYVVLSGGRLYWIVDAYTTSRYFPYSEPFSAIERIDMESGGQPSQVASRVAPQFHNTRYVRNSVKAVVDAFEGTVDLYVFEPEDPLIRAWAGVFPGLFQPRDAMPEPLRNHVRYPSDLFLAQGLVYAKYHMGDPEVFYNQEDLWVRATEKYYGQVRPVDPYYVMWQPPDAAAGTVEFTTIQPFTPKNRQVMIGWLAGLSDGESYGRLIAYKFPKERRVLGPQQVETKIDQDRFLSQQLTLWDQRGSRVIRGNVLALPIGETLLYVEPIYLQAETAAYPELRLVVLMHGDDLAYGNSLLEALAELVGERVALPELEEPTGLLPAPEEELRGEGEPAEEPAEAAVEALPEDVRSLAREADEAFQRYLQLQAERRFAEAAEELDRLGRLLEQLAGGEAGEPPDRR